MAEAFGVAASALTVIELTSKLISQCKHLIETTRNAPQDLNRILVEITSLKAALDSLHFLSSAGSDFSHNVRRLEDAEGAVKGCKDAVGQLAAELDGLVLGSQCAPGKRQKIQGSLKWCFKESSARKLLGDILQHKTTIVLTLVGEVTQDISKIKEDVRVVKETGTAQDRRDICDWLEHTNPTHDHNLACKLHEQQTCEWMLQFDEWKQWLNFTPLKESDPSVDRFLWVHGIPGSGKTVLASYLTTKVEDYCSKMAKPLARALCICYYCSYRHHQDETVPFLSWIATQLCRYLGRVPEIIADCHHLRKEMTITDLKIAIRTLLDDVDIVYIILDAIDESYPRDNLLSVIVDIATEEGLAKIRLLVTSRDYIDIESTLRPVAVSIPMSNPIVDADIRQYVRVVLQNNRRLCRWPHGLKEEILEALVKGSKGMFRWAVCQIDILQRKRKEDEIRKALKELPETLDETYERILLEITREDWPVARLALLWICAHNDLPFKMNIPGQCLIPAIFYGTSSSHFYDLDALQEICGCLINVALVELDRFETTTVSLAHYTVREYLYSDRISRTSVSFFSLDDSITVHEYLKTVFLVSARANPSTLTWIFWVSLESYCYLVAWMSPRLWESRLVADPILRDLFLEQLWRNPSFLYLHSEEILSRWYDDASSYGFFDISSFTNIDPTQWSNLPDDTDIAPLIWGSLLAHRLYHIADAFSNGRNQLEMLLRPLLQIRPRYVDYILGNGLPITNILNFAVNERLLGVLKIAEDFNNKFLLYSTVLHSHELSCHSECIIDRLIIQGHPISPLGVRMTALQLAVHRWDFYGVSRLLHAGANVNEVGDPNGEIPPNVDTIFSACSPLHILRTGVYGLQQIEEHARLRKSREERRAIIEALLLEFGALDFVADQSVDKAPR